MDPTIYAVVAFGSVVGIMTLGGAFLLLLFWSPVQQDRLQPPKPEAGQTSILGSGGPSARVIAPNNRISGSGSPGLAITTRAQSYSLQA